jgi:uncharacterized protein (DUF305 family)
MTVAMWGVLLNVLLAALAGGSPALAQLDHSQHQHHQPSAPGHNHGMALGPRGSTYDLRWIDAMVQHHTGALRMAEVVFDIGSPGVGALAREMWRDQAQEIRAMGQWRRAWYPQAPVYPVSFRPGGDPNSLDGLQPMSSEQQQAMRMAGPAPSPEGRVRWFLESMLHHHGGALEMAHDALRNSTNLTLQRLAREIIVAQRSEILELRRMLQHDGLNRPEYFRYDALFALP